MTAEFGVVIRVYLDNALKAWGQRGALRTEADLKDAIMEGAVLRARPKAMTAVTLFAELIPIMIGHEAGSEVMPRIAAPMIGGMITAPLPLFVIRAVYLLWHRRRLPQAEPAKPPATPIAIHPDSAGE